MDVRTLPNVPSVFLVPKFSNFDLQHYAVKTIENVVSQGGEWAARFASEAVAADLLRCACLTHICDMGINWMD